MAGVVVSPLRPLDEQVRPHSAAETRSVRFILNTPAAEAKPEGDGVDDLIVGGGVEVVGVIWHGWTVA